MRDENSHASPAEPAGGPRDLGDSQQQARLIRMVCLILLMATLLMYANRYAFTQNAVVIEEMYGKGEQGYGGIEAWFGLGFAFGGLTFGVLADKLNVRWLYPAVVVIWSLAGIASALAPSLESMALFRALLGFFQAGHWPCALRTTQRVFLPAQRTWGNSILQSGAALGAVATPLVVAAVYRWNPAEWRITFYVAGGLGIPWALWWLFTVGDDVLKRPVIQTDDDSTGRGAGQVLEEIPFLRIFLTRRWWVLVFVVVAINTVWHYIRVWMPMILEKDHGYSHEFVQYFTSVYYAGTFFGGLTAGWLTIRLASRGLNVHRARMAVFLLCSLLTALSIPAAFAPAGVGLLAMLLAVAAGSLGLFPIYYSLTQELSAKNQGKVGGILGFTAWMTHFAVSASVGRLVDQDPTIRPWLFAAVGIGPLLAYVILTLFWGRRKAEGDAADVGIRPAVAKA